MAAGLLVFAGGPSGDVGELVQFDESVAFDPVELDIVILIQIVEFLDEVEILDFALLLFPAVALPGRGPFGEDVDPKFGVGVDFYWFVCHDGELDSLADGGAFHADVGGVGLSTSHNGIFGAGVDDGPAAGTGIGVGATVGVKCFHVYLL